MFLSVVGTVNIHYNVNFYKVWVSGRTPIEVLWEIPYFQQCTAVLWILTNYAAFTLCYILSGVMPRISYIHTMFLTFGVMLLLL